MNPNRDEATLLMATQGFTEATIGSQCARWVVVCCDKGVRLSILFKFVKDPAVFTLKLNLKCFFFLECFLDFFNSLVNVSSGHEVE